jgi:hypothetical protein
VDDVAHDPEPLDHGDHRRDKRDIDEP